MPIRGGLSVRRASRLAAPGIAAILALSAACQREVRTARPVPSAAPPPDPHADAPPLVLQRDALVQAYRPKPDARFLSAVSTIDATIAGTPLTPAQVDFSNGTWSVKHGGAEVGRLPEMPTYDDAMALLVSLAAASLKAHPLADTSVPVVPWDLPTDDAALTTLEAAQRDWAAGARTGAVLGRAAHALVALQFHLEDKMELGDAIGGRAAAMLAIEAALGAKDASAEDEALFARALGYWGAAQDRAQRLPATSVVRAFLLRDDSTLEKLLRAPNAAPGARGFLVRRLGTTQSWRREGAWIEAEMAGSAYTLPVLFDRLPSLDFSRERSFSYALPYVVFLETLRRSGDARAVATARDLAAWGDCDAFTRAGAKIGADLGVSDAQLIRAFEAALAKVGGSLAGPVFDAGVERAYYEAAFYTGLWSVMHHTIFRWNSYDAAQSALTGWGTDGGDVASDFRLWAQELIDAKKTMRAPTELLATIKDLPHLGPNAHATLFEELVAQGDWGDARVLGAARVLASRLDSRLSHRRTLIDVANRGLHDVALTERVGRGLPAAEAPLFTSQADLITWLTRDVATYEARLEAPGLSPDSSASITFALARLGKRSDDQVRAALRKLVAANPSMWSMRQRLGSYLMDKEAYREARDVVSPWLADNHDKPGLETLEATAMLARAYRLEGKPADAWKLLEPALESQYGRVLGESAATLEALGRADEAERVAQKAFDRYHLVDNLTALVRLYWKHGKTDAATRLLAPPAVPLTLLEQRNVLGPALAGAFAGRSDPELAQAFGALKENGPRFQGELTYGIDRAGRHQLAFDLSAPLFVGGVDGLVDMLRSYGFLESAKSHADAVTWLRSRVPPQLREALSQVAVMDGNDVLLWEVVPTPDPSRHDDHADSVWLFRAFSVARGASEAHREEVKRHYAGPPGGRYDVLGRYILGLAKESDVLALAPKAHDACEVAYWLGFGAQTAGHIEEASGWYRVSVETGLSQVWEYRQAYNQLSGWWDAGKALSLIEAGK
jgi:tetratricopeptide (TPR) repeat protein